jgi:GT2 family glycosyltransferase
MVTVTIVIPCFTERRWDSLLRAVRSAWHQTYDCQVIVVVDHNDHLLARLHSEIGAKTQVVPSRLGPGASGARNTGAVLATSELVAFLEDDAVAEPTWIENLVRAYKETPDAVGFGGAIQPLWGGPVPRWFPVEFSWVVGGTDPRTARARVRNVWGGNMLVPRQSFVAAGGFRTGFGKLGNTSQPEDTELCIRMTERCGPGDRWVLVPDAVVLHEVSAERRTWSFFLRRCWAEGRGKHALWVLTAPGSRALAEETGFVRSVLSRGLSRNLATVTRGDVSGLGRAAAVVLGTAAAGAGFAVAGIQESFRNRWASPWHRPARSAVIDISELPAEDQEAAAWNISPRTADPEVGR